MIERDAEKLLLYAGAGIITLFLLKKAFSGTFDTVSNALVNLADGAIDTIITPGQWLGSEFYDATHSSEDNWQAPTTPQEAQLQIVSRPEEFPMSEVVKAVNNLENSGVMIGSDQMGRFILPFITGNPNFFTADQVRAATSALTGY